MANLPTLVADRRCDHAVAAKSILHACAHTGALHVQWDACPHALRSVQDRPTPYRPTAGRRGARSARRHVGPHVFRHTAAVHLLEAGVDVNVIRGWLGHVSLETTNRYAEINTRMKEAALRLCEPPPAEK